MSLPDKVRGVYENAHVEGLYLFDVDDQTRIYQTKNWTTLSANDYGDAVGFHDHDGEACVQVLYGELVDIKPIFHHPSTESPYEYRKYFWDSNLQESNGRFEKTPEDTVFTDTFLYTILTPWAKPHWISHGAFHAPKTTTKTCIWRVSITQADAPANPCMTVLSRRDLSAWHRQADWYRLIEDTKVAQRLWDSARGMNHNERI
jgi:hypothetical protein